MNTSLNLFLVWLVTGPGVSAALAALAELPYVKSWLDRLPYEAKRLLFLVVGMAVPLAATWLLVALSAEPSTPDLWFRALAAGWAGFLTSQAVHLVVRRWSLQTH